MSYLTITRRIRACESEVPAQLVLEYAIRRAVEEERERCAKVCEDRGNRNRIAAGFPNGDRDEFYCADDIRALGDE